MFFLIYAKLGKRSQLAQIEGKILFDKTRSKIYQKDRNDSWIKLLKMKMVIKNFLSKWNKLILSWVFDLLISPELSQKAL